VVGESRQLFALVTEGIPFARLDLAPDARIFAFTAAVAFVTTLLFGLAPALRATRVDLNTAIKDGARAVVNGWRAGRALVAVQVGLSVILLMGTGLFTRTLYNMKAQDLGCSPENIVVMAVDPVSAGYRGEAIGLACVRLLDSIRAIPGVDAATFSESGLFSNTESAAVDVEGFTPSTDRDREIRFDQVGPAYFRSIGIPMRATSSGWSCARRSCCSPAASRPGWSLRWRSAAT
jgi:hypothetical protein